MQTFENNKYYTLGARSLVVKLMRGILAAGTVLVLVGIVALAKSSSIIMMLETAFSVDISTYIVIGGVGLACALGLLGALIGWIEYKMTTVMLTDNALYIRTGIIQINEISVPLRHIQNITQKQGILDRIFNVCTCALEIQDGEVSATTSTSKVSDDIVLYQVDMDLVVPLRETILSRTNTQRMAIVDHI